MEGPQGSQILDDNKNAEKSVSIKTYQINSKKNNSFNNHTYSNCFFLKNLDLLEKKWSIKILLVIMRGATRFNEIQRRLKKITPKMLSMRLRELEQRGLITKRIENNKIVYLASSSLSNDLECAEPQKAKIE
ncbi:MAG: helix-turn-helix transcriptional regulator [Candidatus Micrarchaeota archaeon]|nr:helix-turn-helix transcriptional regulator [Candidatus Micrarchaeota archaeon]